MTKFVLFGGKGGVGKTTCAAAHALYLAEHGKKTLIVSTDPAHSLGDSFEKKLSGNETEISKNMYAAEINPKENISAFMEKISSEKSSMPKIHGFDISELTPLSGLDAMPGIDEMTAFDKFLQYVSNSAYDYIVFDTAPTGHTLRFLKMPAVMDSWLGKMLKLRLQISSAMNMFKQLLPFSEKEKDDSLKNLEEMKKRIALCKDVLTSKEKTEFILVTIPQEMAILETERYLKQLSEFGIHAGKIIVNQVQPETNGQKCPLCSERRKMHLQKIVEIRQKFKGIKILSIPLFKEEIKGMKNLRLLGEKLK